MSETAQNVSDTIRETAASTAAAAQDMGRGAASAVMGRSSNNQGSGSFEQPTPGRSLYVGNLFFETTTDALRSEFSQFGEIVDCRVVQDNQGLSKGYVICLSFFPLLSESCKLLVDMGITVATKAFTRYINKHHDTQSH